LAEEVRPYQGITTSIKLPPPPKEDKSINLSQGLPMLGIVGFETKIVSTSRKQLHASPICLRRLCARG